MRVVEATFEIEREIQVRSHDGRSSEIMQVDSELADARTAMIYVYFLHDDEPLTLLIDLERPASEASFSRDALTRALLTSSSAAPLQ